MVANSKSSQRWFFPNMTCVRSSHPISTEFETLMLILPDSQSIAPYITNVNVTYHNATGQFTAEVINIPRSYLRIPYHLSEVTLWLFRVAQVMTGNQAVNAMIALQNTP